MLVIDVIVDTCGAAVTSRFVVATATSDDAGLKSLPLIATGPSQDVLDWGRFEL